MTSRFLFFLGCLLLPLRVAATAQFPEVLRYEGKTYYLETTPLSAYLLERPNAIPQSRLTSTALWRGYVGTWSVRDKRLLLEDIRIPTDAFSDSDAPESEQYRSVMVEVFGCPGPVHATWFTGRLIVPTGKIVDYVHMGFASTYSSYLVVTVVGGSVTATERMKLREFQVFRRRQFELFKKTPEYAEAVAELKKSDAEMTAERIDEFLYLVNTGRFDSRIFDGAESAAPK